MCTTYVRESTQFGPVIGEQFRSTLRVMLDVGDWNTYSIKALRREGCMLRHVWYIDVYVVTKKEVARGRAKEVLIL